MSEPTDAPSLLHQLRAATEARHADLAATRLKLGPGGSIKIAADGYAFARVADGMNDREWIAERLVALWNAAAEKEPLK